MIVFVPIKERSQRVPGKNFRTIGSVPLYKRCLKKLTDHEVFVDTDSKNLLSMISNDSDLSHVTAYERPEHLKGHEISVCDLIENFIQRFNIRSHMCQVHVTSPFLNVKTIEKAYREMLENEYDSIAACNRYQNRLWRKEEYGYCPVNHNPCKLEQTQDLPVFYEENSLFYIFDSQDFLKTKLRIGVNPSFYPCTFPENLDIDTEDDWKIVTSVAKGESL